jgi:hypothetical protein
MRQLKYPTTSVVEGAFNSRWLDAALEVRKTVSDLLERRQ